MPRIINLEGSVNFRDFGGYETVHGARIKEGVLFRSGTMTELSERGRRDFLSLGIGVICDLRRPYERTAEPTPFPAHDPKQVHVPIDPDSAVLLREALELDPVDLDRRVQFMLEINRELARAHVNDYRRVFDAVIEADGRGFVIHCAAGKDRTGFGVALIQSALGVPRDAVMADYMLTNTAVDFEQFMLPRIRARITDREIDVEAARALAGVRAEYLHAALGAVDEAFGSMERYLESQLGVDSAKRTKLERALLV